MVMRFACVYYSFYVLFTFLEVYYGNMHTLFLVHLFYGILLEICFQDQRDRTNDDQKKHMSSKLITFNNDNNVDIKLLKCGY